MAKKSRTEYPEPDHGTYPGFLEKVSDVTITVKATGEDRESCQWDWTYLQDGQTVTGNDLTSDLWSKGSDAGKRYMGIVGVIDNVPVDFDTDDMLHVPCFITWGPNSNGKTKVTSVTRMSRGDQGRYPELMQLLNQGDSKPPYRQNVTDEQDRSAVQDAMKQNSGEDEEQEDFDDIPF